MHLREFQEKSGWTRILPEPSAFCIALGRGARDSENRRPPGGQPTGIIKIARSHCPGNGGLGQGIKKGGRAFYGPSLREGSGTEAMFADGGDDGPAENPLVSGFLGVVIVDGAAGGIPSVDGVLGGPAGRVGYRLIKLPVV